MSELTSDLKPRRLRRLWQALRQNPVTIKELRSRMRGRRAFVVLTIYLFIMSAFISLIYLAYAQSARGPYGPDPRDAGKVVFSAVLGIQVFLVLFVGPAFTAGAVSGEKERQTYDLLRTTLLTANAFILGKLVSALSYVFLLIFAAVPLQSIAFLLGGISLAELILSQLLVFVAAVTFAMFGLYCSTSLRSTLAASVVTFAGTFFTTIGLPLIILLFVGFLGSLIFSSSLSWISEMALAYIGLALAATNLPATLIISDIFLIEQGSLFLYKTSFGPRTTLMPSPWPIFLILYILLALLLYWLAVRKIRKISDR